MSHESISVAMIGPFPQIWGGRHKAGGVATHVYNLIPHLARQNVHLSILADNTDAATAVPIPELANDVQVHSMVRPQGLHMVRDLARLGLGRIGRISWRVLSQPQLRRAAPLSYQPKLIAQAVNFDRFLADQTPDVLHVQHAEYRPYLLRRVLQVDTPLVATVHGVTKLVTPGSDWLFSLITANYLQVDWLIAVSNYVREVVVEHGANPDRITVIPNGVDVDVFAPSEIGQARARLDLPPDHFIVLFIGNLEPWKGVDVLLRACQCCAAKHPDLHIIVIGEGPERETLVKLVAELGLAQRVTFVGYRPLSEMPLWYQASNVFVLPSRAEGFGLAALEAMACGKPVIVSSPPLGEHDFVRQDITGLLVDYGDVDQLAHALDRLASSPDLVQRLSAKARKLVERQFSWDIIGRETVQVYRHLLAERQRRTAQNDRSAVAESV
jgi:glycosyltransferase involved in cell wall biosynthesis